MLVELESYVVPADVSVLRMRSARDDIAYNGHMYTNQSLNTTLNR